MRRRADHDVGEQRAEDEVDLVLVGELLDHFGAALRIRAVVLDHQLDRPARDAADLVDVLDGGLGGAFVPAAVGRADARPVDLEAEPDRARRCRTGRTPSSRAARRRAGKRASRLQRSAPRERPGSVEPRCPAMQIFLHQPLLHVPRRRQRLRPVRLSVKPSVHCMVGSTITRLSRLADRGRGQQPQTELGVADHQRRHR